VLSIAGSDSGAGAGIQADLKMFSALGVYGCTAITAITAQNTKGVSKIFEVSSSIVEQQIRSIMTDMPPNAIKIGMVYSSAIIDAVYRSVKKTSKIPIVLDPILAAGTGAKLLRSDAYKSFVSKLIPLSTLITPNRMEAEKLAGIMIKTENDAIEAAKKIWKLGTENVLIKGGHLGSAEVTDLLLDDTGNITKFTNPRVEGKEFHGSGCNFSSAVTAYIAKGVILSEACKMANEYVHVAIKNSTKIGKGLPIANPHSVIYRDANSYRVLVELQQAVEHLSTLDRFSSLIPETQTNFAYALSNAVNISDVAAVRGRIIRVENLAVPASYIKFGASNHVASAVIAYMSVNPDFRCAINIRFDEQIINVCKSLFSVSSYDRAQEPKTIKRREGSSVAWGVVAALSKNRSADVIYHRGDVGKEPMITVFGRNPAEVVGKIKVLLKNYGSV
ncbi:MAG: bifunctional hydroxymethylpyrimidine kinase/phosphomethylpyrimidine kinase, partial [Thermoproteota archaeon]|nr:bifunctional hydroxymethylpyrimidine kinase/phosphomethylpyrimidine kinase [Thermoproteota archaeon]